MIGIQGWKKVKHLFGSLFVVLALAACEDSFTTEVHLPEYGYSHTYRYDIRGEKYLVTVFFPDGRNDSDPKSVVAHIEKNPRATAQNRIFPWTVRLDEKSKYEIGNALWYHKKNSKTEEREAVVELLLLRKIDHLPAARFEPGPPLDWELTLQSNARLFFEDRERRTVGYCNGVLVGKKLLLTNHHCIPDAKDCSIGKAVFFDGKDFFKRSCSKIVLSRPESDQVLVELDEPVPDTNKPAKTVEKQERYVPGTTLFQASRFEEWEELANGTLVNTMKGEGPFPISVCSVFRYVSNRVVDRTDHEKKAGQLITDHYVTHCPARPGQSGSGIFNSIGLLVGLTFLAVEYKDLNQPPDSAFVPLHPTIVREITRRNSLSETR